MLLTSTDLPDVLLIMPQVFGDNRGYFMETWNQIRYAAAGLDVDFVQSNVSKSEMGSLRGLHFQFPNPQGKLVYVLQGEVYDVAVDVRVGSPHFGKWVGLILSEKNRHQLYIPPGFAHGFCVTSGSALFAYHCTTPYDPDADGVIAWDDPELGIDWPVEEPVLSDKDATAPKLKDLLDRLPSYEG
ncbi:MAG: dTDP-4-dehydrorhamnose 3,5-epimerase [Gammaproteobacteria bacterium]|nr:MAG: dTDP-4-dehydrorhamnose 3,5-epimerase [Gammaproteobacteria bacterium]